MILIHVLYRLICNLDNVKYDIGDENDLSPFNSINVNRRNIGIKPLRLTPTVDIWKLTNKNRKIRGCIIGVKHIYFLLLFGQTVFSS